MRSTLDVCRELRDKLKAAGYTGSALDPADLNPPGAVWIQPRYVHDLTLGGGGELAVWLYLIVPNTDYEHAWTLLDDGLTGLVELLDEWDIPLADVEQPIDLTAAVLLDGHSAPSPAYRLAIDLDLGDTA